MCAKPAENKVGAAACPAVALAPASPGVALSGPRVRGWLQREIDEGLREAPVAQTPMSHERSDA
jgi:hypothetical protein